MNLCTFKQPFFSIKGFNGLEVQWTMIFWSNKSMKKARVKNDMIYTY